MLLVLQFTLWRLVVQAELFTDAPYYVRGEQVEYHLVVQNIVRGIAKDGLSRFMLSSLNPW
ncbi:hypothetical protein OH492_18975 [Vibrio chagasii]|nr:hypothetical protein [Vibrio chagasii]